MFHTYISGPEACGVCGSESVKLCTKCSVCDKSLCETCTQQHRDDSELTSHELVTIPVCSTSSESEDCTLVCPNHDGNSLQVMH